MILAAGIIIENVVLTRMECKEFRFFYCSPGPPAWKEESEIHISRHKGREQAPGGEAHTHLRARPSKSLPEEQPPGLSLDGGRRAEAPWTLGMLTGPNVLAKAQVKPRPFFFWHFPCLVVIDSLRQVHKYLSPTGGSHLWV